MNLEDLSDEREMAITDERKRRSSELDQVHSRVRQKGRDDSSTPGRAGDDKSNADGACNGVAGEAEESCWRSTCMYRPRERKREGYNRLMVRNNGVAAVGVVSI